VTRSARRDVVAAAAWIKSPHIEERSPGSLRNPDRERVLDRHDPQFKTFSTRIDPPENAGSIGYTALFEFMMIIP
jgi:hypothetical protein